MLLLQKKKKSHQTETPGISTPAHVLQIFISSSQESSPSLGTKSKDLAEFLTELSFIALCCEFCQWMYSLLLTTVSFLLYLGKRKKKFSLESLDTKWCVKTTVLEKMLELIFASVSLKVIALSVYIEGACSSSPPDPQVKRQSGLQLLVLW